MNKINIKVLKTKLFIKFNKKLKKNVTSKAALNIECMIFIKQEKIKLTKLKHRLPISFIIKI